MDRHQEKPNVTQACPFSKSSLGVGSTASDALREKTTLYEILGGTWLFPAFSKAIILRHMTKQSNVFGSPQLRQLSFFRRLIATV